MIVEKKVGSSRKLHLIVGLFFLGIFSFVHAHNGRSFANENLDLDLCPEPDAFCNWNVTGLTVSFQDMSSNSPSSWFWQFGDGNVASGINPTHTYSGPGTYTVCLTSTNACGSDSWCTQVTVYCHEPDAQFMEAASGRNVSFIDFSSNNPTWWSWDFGDGFGSSSQYPIHYYAFPGAYQVCLIAGNNCGADTFCTTVQVTCTAPTADFYRTASGATVTFTDQSSNTPTAWAWDFGDGHTSHSSNPQHTYSAPGIYQVTLQVQSGCGSSTVTKPVQINCAFIQSDFLYTANSLTVRFSDQSNQAANTWNWEFGDGNQSTQEHPIHAYAQPGTYTVSLTVTNGCNVSSYQKQVTVNCGTMSAHFNEVNSGFTADFTDLCQGSPVWWVWDFGDGASSNLQHPSHTYNKKGKYKVCLLAGSPCGVVSTCRIIEIDPSRRKTQPEAEQALAGEIQFVPNPSQGRFHLSGDYSQIREVRVYNLQGALLANFSGDWDQGMDLEHLPNGLYLAEIRLAGQSYTKRLQINH